MLDRGYSAFQACASRPELDLDTCDELVDCITQYSPSFVVREQLG